jgi:Inositol 1,3,4-trisphosphate 5/6-kinase ATP-grasp domain
MKNASKVTRIKLNINLSKDLIMVGLVSSEPDYKLSLSLNKKFRISLKNISPIKIKDSTGSELSFSRFSNSAGSPDIIYTLISNRTGKQFLIRNLKNVDYILQVQDSENENMINNLTSELREIGSGSALFNIDINTLKEKNLHYLTL